MSGASAFALVVVASYLCLLFHTSAADFRQPCSDGVISFELITGHVYSASTDTIKTIPGTVHLTDCLQECLSDVGCQSVNFETGLCVLFISSPETHPNRLKPSQFPVFTLTAQKMCFSAKVRGTCDRKWTFERVLGYELRKYIKRRLKVNTKVKCMESCLMERDFECRSVSFSYSSGDCLLSDNDRHTLSAGPDSGHYFLPSVNGSVDYFENNCIKEPQELCNFRPITGRVLKTVDSIYEDVQEFNECREKCLQAPYRCFSFDLGDPSHRLCRTSHLDAYSLTHIKDAYFEFKTAVTYQLASCYNVTMICGPRQMVAKVKTNKLFDGKIYDKSKPKSCSNDVRNSLEFEISMAYNDIGCKVRQLSPGIYRNEIILQHHDKVVTNNDLGLSVQCVYKLENRSVATSIHLETVGELLGSTGAESIVHSALVSGPNLTMSITNGKGKFVQKAKVGEMLTIRIQIKDIDSPFDISVQGLLAVDGVDDKALLLIDSHGCPTDSALMGAIVKSRGSIGKVLEATFEAFKFPTSNVVEFKATVTPCLSSCQPVHCYSRGFDGSLHQSYSFGRKRRRTNENTNNGVTLSQAITIADTFDFDNNFSGQIIKRKEDVQSCYRITILVISCLLILFVQVFVLFVWSYSWLLRLKRNRAHLVMANSTLSSSLTSKPSQMLTRKLSE